MDKELKAKWVAALRDGSYSQARGLLYDEENESFCCMGVLAHLTGRKKETMNGIPVDMNNRNNCDRLIARPDSDHIQCVLERMNDSGKSFSEIADYIEANL